MVKFSERDFREDVWFGESDFGENRTTRTLNHRNSIFEIINRDLFRERFQKFKFLIIENYIFFKYFYFICFILKNGSDRRSNRTGNKTG